jgi:signal transduction histidine kinase
MKFSIYLILFIAFGFVCYFLAKHFLTPLAKTKFLLELLLKDTLHELNIPLSVIQANLQMLKRGELDVKRLKRFSRIELACDDLKRLYKDMDYYIKREVRQDIDEIFDLKELIEQEIEKFKEQKTKIILVFDNDKNDKFYADKHGFQKVFTNILSNALKYNKENNDIVIKYKDKRLSIADSGIGMSEQEVFRIFDRYYRLDSEKEGYGIGLSIVKAYCDEKKIFINIISKPQIGTKVTLDLKNILYEEEESENEK